METSSNTIRRSAAPAAAVLCAVIAFRLWGAYLQRFDRNVDFALYALMARSIAAGADFPAFYWGQEYLGPLESWLTAGLLRVFGESPSIWPLVPTLLGIAALGVVFAWARRIAGAGAAAVAVAWLTIGPDRFFEYHTRLLGYSVIVFLNLAVLWRTAIAVEGWREHRRVRAGELFLIGLCGGLGGWCSPLTTAALAAAAATGLIFLRKQAFQFKTLWAAAGFLLGSSPVWIWNVSHNFRSLTLARRVSPARFDLGLQRLFTKTLPAAWGPASAQNPINAVSLIALGIAAAALIVFVAALFQRSAQESRGRRARETPSLAILTIYFVAAAVLFVSTRYGQLGGQGGSGRYLFAAFAAFSIPLGFAADRAFHAGGWIRAGAAVALAFLLAAQVPAFRRQMARARRDREAWRASAELARDLRERGVEAMYVNRFRVWLNVALGDEFVFWMPEGRHRPYWERLESARRVAVADDAAQVKDFLAFAGGRARYVATPPGLAYWADFQPPGGRRREIPAEQWRAADAREGAELPELSDRVFSTALLLRADEEREVELKLDEPKPVCGLRWIGPAERFGVKQAGLRAWDAEEGKWVEIRAPTPVPEGQWVGDRPYFGGVYPWRECRFPPIRTDRLRLGLKAHRRQTAHLAELFIFEAEDMDAPPAFVEAISPLLTALKAQPLDRIAADRWVAARIREACPDAPPVTSEPYLDDRNAPYDPFLAPEGRIALVTAVEAAASTRAALDRAGWQWDRREIGPYAIFFAQPRDPVGARPLRWIGFGALVSETFSAPSAAAAPAPDGRLHSDRPR